MMSFWMPFLPIITQTENGITIVLIVTSLITLITLIFRHLYVLNMGESIVRIDRPRLEASPVNVFKNPFVFKITDDCLKTADFVNGIRCVVSCDNSYWIISYWGVEINALHQHLQCDSHVLREKILNGSLFDDNCIVKSEPDLFHECGDEQTHVIKPPNGFDENSLGQMPRSKYPLVMIVLRNDDDDGEEFKHNDVISLIAAIHIRDSICRMESRILIQLLKQRNGFIYDLRQLFVPDPSAAPSTATQTNTCVICRSTLISRALLPCRHACLCGACFERVDKCPLCRCSIESFFKLRDENDDDDDEEMENVNENRQSQGWFSNVNRKINQWLRMN